MIFQDLSPADHAWVIALGNAHATQTGPLDQDHLAHLVEASFVSWVIRPDLGFMITFAPDAAYESPNFRWFVAREKHFIYVDRIVIADHAKGQGLARKLYEALFATAASQGYSAIVCEINANPPNPASDQFHAALGFTPVGRADLPSGKSVTYVSRSLKD